MYTLEDVSSVAHFITAYEESQSNRDSHFQTCNVFFVCKDNLFDIYFKKNIKTFCHWRLKPVGYILNC